MKQKLLTLFAVLLTALTASAQTRNSIMLLDSISDGSYKKIYDWNDHGHLVAIHKYCLEDGVWLEETGYGDYIYEYEYDENDNCTRMSKFDLDEEANQGEELERRIATYDENGNRISVKIFYKRDGEWVEKGTDDHRAAPKKARGDFFSYRDGDWSVEGIEGDYLLRMYRGDVPSYKNPEDFQIYCQDVMDWYTLPLDTLDYVYSAFKPLQQVYIWDEETGKWLLQNARGKTGEMSGETITYYEYNYGYKYDPDEVKYYATEDGKFDDVPYSYTTTVTVNNLGYILRSDSKNTTEEYNYLDSTPLLSYKTTINKNTNKTVTERHYYSGHKLATGIIGIASDALINGKAYNLQGVEVGPNYKGVVIQNGKKFIKR